MRETRKRKGWPSYHPGRLRVSHTARIPRSVIAFHERVTLSVGQCNYNPSAFFREETRRRETGIFSSTPSRERSRVPPDWGSTSLTRARLTR